MLRVYYTNGKEIEQALVQFVKYIYLNTIQNRYYTK